MRSERRRVETRDLLAQLVCQGFRRTKDPKLQRGEDGAPMLAETWLMNTGDGPIVVRISHPLKDKEKVDEGRACREATASEEQV